MNAFKDQKKWTGFLSQVRGLLSDFGFQEVITPSLVSSPAMEATLFGFKVLDEQNQKTYYLPTSPEFGLKKLWLQNSDLGQIFEIAKAFRANEEGSLWHLPEFLMLEFYSSHLSGQEFKNLVWNFVCSCLNQNPGSLKVLSLPKLFHAVTGFELKPDSSKEFLKEVLSFHSLPFSKNLSWNDLYQLIYLQLMEPALAPHGLFFLEDYPPQLAALAKINSKGWADRFEVFCCGVELGNAYNELFDVEEHKKRWANENQTRQAEGHLPHPIDQELLQALSTTSIKQGWGIALGLERLLECQALFEDAER